MVRQAWLITVMGIFLIGCVFLLVLGCSGDTGSQPAGSQKSEDSESTDAGSEQSRLQDSESTYTRSENGRSPDSESTYEASGSGGSITRSPGFPDFDLRFDGVTYDTPFEGEVVGRPLRDEDLGPKFSEVPYGNGGSEQSASPTTVVGAASEEVPVYAVEGYDTSYRLAARVDDRLIMFEALYNPSASEASEVLDIRDKVDSISVTYKYDADREFGTVEDSEEVEQLVEELMDAPLKTTKGDYYVYEDEVRTNFLVVFHLKDGTAQALHYRRDSGRLTNMLSGSPDRTPASGIVTPKSFREAVDRPSRDT